MEFWALVMLGVVILLLLFGYPVAFTLGAVSAAFGLIWLGLDFFSLLPMRIWGVMTNFTLLAVPLFVFMGVMLEKSGIAEELLETMAMLFGRIRGGLAISIVLVGALLAATTGVVGATVVTMAIIALPAMLKHGYNPALASGTIAASGTLGQIIPPSIVLILLGDVMGVPVGELFMGAVIPGLLLILMFIAYIAFVAWRRPDDAPAINREALAVNDGNALFFKVLKSLIPPLALVFSVLGSIFFGIATPTESAAVGAMGAMVLALIHRRLNRENLQNAMRQTTKLTSMVFLILIGATTFGLVFKGMGGDDLVHDIMTGLPGGVWGFIIVSMLLLFILGFFLDFLEICFIAVPILTPIAIYYGIDPLWFAILIAVNLQTSFLTPPFGFSLFYLKAAAPPSIQMAQIYRGIIPFVFIQLIVLGLLMSFPGLTTWLPGIME
ncbi:TRAP dicarboxylate transporter, DctM subunit, unknown substrate 6 [hydrothermal vent metagenome]|uniref:TRAP C4-dicarboxylate transport system permease DctM subunit domain-containing protein n=1 Tax=hydrothermal vent metagenome TaxID=652676 RepID=A0A3B0ZSC0_9ZZZZ